MYINCPVQDREIYREYQIGGIPRRIYPEKCNDGATHMRILAALSHGASHSDSCAYMSESTEQQTCITTSAEIPRCSTRGVRTVLSW